MKLKCIGGPNDNEYWEVPDHFKYGDIVPVYQYPKSVIVDSFPTNVDECIQAISIDQVMYRVSCFRCRKEYVTDTYNELKFLVLNTMSDWEAIQLQFTKSIPEEYTNIIKLLIDDFGSSYLKEQRKQIIKLGKYLGMTEDQLPIKGM